MILRSAIAAIASVLLASAALAAPALKGDIIVNAAVVTVGDMFDDAGLSAEDALFRAPKPGTTGTVSLADIQSAAARIGLGGFDARGLDAVNVRRAAAIVDETALADLINADLVSRGILTAGMSANTMFTTPIKTINAENVEQPATVISLRYLPGTGAFSARIAIAGQDNPIDVSGTIELMIDAPHLTGSFAAGTVLTAADVVLRPIPLRYAESTGVAQLDQIVGKALTRQSREGMMLKPSDVAVPFTVAKNDLVTIYFRSGPMTLTVKGQAVTSATIGAPLQVLNLMSRRVISATAIAAGAVEVTPAALTLAGL
ncbi:MAG: flagellar basal body P-ring formation chaperone FlgA [Alphaproteobacteria bacterium]|nr:flagellar basal body P-ring formation chaperone FlgA [Alphaproteobacteria bacterium]